MAKITWTQEAQRWLEDIFGYIASDNPSAAAETVQGIYDRAQALADFPEMGQRYFASERNVRILLYGHYRITYLLKPEGDVDILGVFHGALDISKYEL
jgi:toxin ParE1/3/4